MRYAKGSNVKPRWHRYDDWDVTVLEVVRYDSDAIIVMAGQQGVVQAGIAGWMLGVPPFPSAGSGAGRRRYGTTPAPIVSGFILVR